MFGAGCESILVCAICIGFTNGIAIGSIEDVSISDTDTCFVLFISFVKANVAEIIAIITIIAGMIILFNKNYDLN